MPRTKQTELDRDLLYERWRVFGRWLRERRLIRGSTQKEVAQAVGVSEHQWIRYEQGAKMLRKRMRAAARALNVPLETMLNRAGYKTSPRRNDVEGRLAGLGQLLFVGKLDLAILGLLRLNDRIAVKRSCADPKGGGVAATDFARAFELLDRLPNLHLALILKTMQKRINDKTRV